MVSVWRAVQIGAGLAAAGYGLYRLGRGRRDWLTKTMLSTGLTASVNGLVGRRFRFRSRSGQLLLRQAPQVLAAMSSAAVQAMR